MILVDDPSRHQTVQVTRRLGPELIVRRQNRGRFVGDPLAGGMPRWKHVGNRLLTVLENVVFGLHLSEYHTRFRAWSRHLLETIPYERSSDDFVVNQELATLAVVAGLAIGEIAVLRRYSAEASSVGLRRSIVHELSPRRASARFALDRVRVRPSTKLMTGMSRTSFRCASVAFIPECAKPQSVVGLRRHPAGLANARSSTDESLADEPAQIGVPATPAAGPRGRARWLRGRISSTLHSATPTGERSGQPMHDLLIGIKWPVGMPCPSPTGSRAVAPPRPNAKRRDGR